jgi:hypothetical protein
LQALDALEFYKDMVAWIVPAMLVWAIHYLAEIAKSLSQIKTSLAVVVTKIENHEHRIARLEDRLEKREAAQHFN